MGTGLGDHFATREHPMDHAQYSAMTSVVTVAAAGMALVTAITQLPDAGSVSAMKDGRATIAASQWAEASHAWS